MPPRFTKVVKCSECGYVCREEEVDFLDIVGDEHDEDILKFKCRHCNKEVESLRYTYSSEPPIPSPPAPRPLNRSRAIPRPSAPSPCPTPSTPEGRRLRAALEEEVEPVPERSAHDRGAARDVDNWITIDMLVPERWVPEVEFHDAPSAPRRRR